MATLSYSGSSTNFCLQWAQGGQRWVVEICCQNLQTPQEPGPPSCRCSFPTCLHTTPSRKFGSKSAFTKGRQGAAEQSTQSTAGICGHLCAYVCPYMHVYVNCPMLHGCVACEYSVFHEHDIWPTAHIQMLPLDGPSRGGAKWPQKVPIPHYRESRARTLALSSNPTGPVFIVSHGLKSVVLHCSDGKL